MTDPTATVTADQAVGAITSTAREEIEALVDARDSRIADLEARVADLTPDPFLFGMAHGSNTDPGGVEKHAGARVGARVTYWNLGQIDKAVAVVGHDLEMGRTPWPSFKFTMPWADVVAGKADDLVRELDEKLNALPGRKFLTFHHEPAGDEPDMSLYAETQRRVFGLVQDPDTVRWQSLTGWTNLYGGVDAYQAESLWAGDDVADGLSFDPYNEYASVRHPTGEKYWGDLIAYFDYLSAFAGEHHCLWGIRETGITTRAVESGHPGAATWITDTAAKAKARGAAAFCYFHTTLNTPDDLTVNNSAAKRADLYNAIRRNAVVIL